MGLIIATDINGNTSAALAFHFQQIDISWKPNGGDLPTELIHPALCPGLQITDSNCIMTLSDKAMLCG